VGAVPACENSRYTELKHERQEQIIELLRAQGEVAIAVMADLLHVTEMTIHRDLDYLQSKNLVTKKRGGAMLVEDSDGAGTLNILEKEAIASEAIRRISNGDSIIFDNSTTALEVAKRLGGFTNLTVYATNLQVANELANNDRIILHSSGCLYFRQSIGFIGRVAEEFVSQLHVTKCFVGTSGISIEHGLTCPYHFHVQLQQKIMAASEQVILVADHTKFGKVAIDKVADIADVDCIITDSRVDKEAIAAIRKITKVIVVPLRPSVPSPSEEKSRARLTS
jgi:DeoR family transcriptional regulator, fructose operon transcriptional repressor